MQTNEIERARDRIAERLRPTAPDVCVAFSGGKDSTLLLQLTLEARERVDPRQREAADAAA